MRFDYFTAHADDRRLLRHPGDWIAYGVLLAILCAVPFLLPRFYVGEMNYLFIVGIASIGLMLLTGCTGQVSLGHAAFMAIGAYAHAILLAQGLPWVLSLLASSAVAAACGLVVGLPAIRTTGLYLAMVTLAFSLIVEHVIGRWKSLTGGFSGLAVPEPSIAGLAIGSISAYYGVCLAILFGVVLGAANLLRSRTGRAFIAVRDSEAAAWGLGIDLARTKLLAFALSSAVCGLAGALLAHHLKFLTPEAFNLMISMELVLMVVIGGLGSVRGALFGAVLIGLLPSAISAAKPLLAPRLAGQAGLEVFLFGLVLVLFVLFEPRGLEGRWRKLRHFIEYFPLYRRDTFRRAKTYMRSERVR